MPTPEAIAQSFCQLDFHDDTLVGLRALPAQHQGEGAVMEIHLHRWPGQRRVIQFSRCTNLRVAMGFDVLAANLPTNTSRVEAHTDPARLCSLMRSQEKDWDVRYAGTATSPLTKKLAALDALVCFRVQFFGGAVEVIAREYEVKTAHEPLQGTPQ